MKAKGKKFIAENRKARHNYTIEAEYEAGIILYGTEVKALRNGQANLKDAYAKIKNQEVFLKQMHIGPYKHAGNTNHDSLRERKLLLHKREIERLGVKLNERGLSLIPLTLYFKDGKIKVSLALARGKQLHDKRDAIKAKDAEREIARTKKKYRT